MISVGSIYSILENYYEVSSLNLQHAATKDMT